jgi:hypothetical protein
VSSSPFYRVGGGSGAVGRRRGSGRPNGEGDRAAGGGSINAGHPVRWRGKGGGGEWGVKRGGHRGGGSMRRRRRQWCPVGLLEEEGRAG